MVQSGPVQYGQGVFTQDVVVGKLVVVQLVAMKRPIIGFEGKRKIWCRPCLRRLDVEWMSVVKLGSGFTCDGCWKQITEAA